MGYLSLEEIETNFIEKRNKSLWDKLKNKFIIGVIDDHVFYELRYLHNNLHVVILTNKIYNPSLFTHELLHLNLRYNGLDTFLFYESISQPFLATMAYTILNCIEHVLFFDDFIDMGYKKEEFVMDYANSEYNLINLKKAYSDLQSFSDGQHIIDLFLYYVYWTLKNEEYMGVDRNKDFLWLKSSNPLIFAKCERMFDEIVDFDLESTSVQKDFNQLLSKYLRRNY